MAYIPSRFYAKLDTLTSKALRRVTDARGEPDPREVGVDLIRERLVALGELPAALAGRPTCPECGNQAEVKDGAWRCRSCRRPVFIETLALVEPEPGDCERM